MSTYEAATPALPVTAVEAVKARGYWETVWFDFARPLALLGGVVILFIFFVALFGAPIAAHLLGHGPDDLFRYGVDQTRCCPWAHVRGVRRARRLVHALHSRGDSTIGRDEFLRLLYGARVSLEVAVLATFFAAYLGVITGVLAGYFGGVTTR